MIKNGMILGIIFIICSLVACGLTPKPLSVDERYTAAKNEVNELFKDQVPQPNKLDYYQALARCTHYNLDYRLKLVNTALQSNQLDIATLTLFPSLNATGSLYTRNNDFNTSGITSNGISTGLSSSTPRTIRTARVAMSWNILDFAMGYVRAKQQSERVLIAEEESRHELQQLSQDLLVAYWSAYSAQELMREAREFQNLLAKAKLKLARAQHDQDVPQENILNYQAALLEGNRRLIQLQYKYEKSMSDLKHLLFLPLNQTVVLAPPPQAFIHSQDFANLDFQKMDAVTLVANPQLRGEHYQQRIAELGVRTVILQALPGITLNYGWNYTSNKFIQNKVWLDRSMDVAWNLLNLASLPTSYRTAKIQVKYEKIKQMALTMGALTESRYSFSHYLTLRKEYRIAHLQSENSKALYILNRNRRSASLASDQQVLLAKLKMITSKMDEDLLLSDLSVALGQLYLSVGADILPEDILTQPYEVAVENLRRNLIFNSSKNFGDFIDNSYNNLFVKNHSNAAIIRPVYTIQLAGSYQLKDIQQMQTKLKNIQPLSIAKTKRNEKDWYILTKEKLASIKEVESDRKKLPPLLSKNSWIRKADNNVTWLS